MSTATWEERGNRRNFVAGDKVYALIDCVRYPAVVLAAVPPADGIAGLAKVKIAVKGEGGRWRVVEYGKPVQFAKMTARDKEIEGLDG